MKRSLGPKTIAFPTPTWVVGTYDSEGKPNVMTAAWGGICCSRPPCVYVSLRKATYTYGNIVERKAFTINILSERYVKEADFFGISSGKDVNKFSECSLTPKKSVLVNAPYIEESPIVLECKILQIIEIGLHTQFIGEIMDVKANSDILNENGFPDIEKVKPIIYEPGNRRYYTIGSLLGQAFSIGKASQSSSS